MTLPQIAIASIFLCGVFANSPPVAGQTPRVEWLLAAQEPNAGLSDPLLTGEMVVVGSDSGLLRAFNAQSGAELWRYTHGTRIYHRPDCDERRIFAISEFDGAIAVDRRDGHLLWSLPSQFGYGALAVCANAKLAFIAGNDGVVRAVDAATGNERWAADVLQDAPHDPPGFDGDRARFTGKPARPTGATCDGKWLFVSLFDQSRVVGFDITDGSKKFDYQSRGWVYHAPLVDDDRLYISSQDQSMHCVERTTSKLLWRFQTKGRVESSAAAEDGKVYFGSCDGGFYCLDRETGKMLWKFDIETDGQRTKAIYSDPLVLGDEICFAAGEGQVYALDIATGKLRWKFRPLRDAELFTSPASNGALIFATSRPHFDGAGRGTTGGAALIAIDPYFQFIDPFARRPASKAP